jgi:hypothetical protein
LLSLFLTSAGVTLIVVSQDIQTKTISEIVLGLGIGLLPTGFVSLLQSYFTDAIYRQDMAHDIRERVQEGFERVHPLLSDGTQLGVERVYRTRGDALQDFAARMEEEINRATRARPGRLWFVCTSMRGFLHHQGPGFKPKELLEKAAAKQRELERLRDGCCSTLTYMRTRPTAASRSSPD